MQCLTAFWYASVASRWRCSPSFVMDRPVKVSQSVYFGPWSPGSMSTEDSTYPPISMAP